MKTMRQILMMAASPEQFVPRIEGGRDLGPRVVRHEGERRIYLSPEMGDLDRPFSVELDDGCVLLVNVERISGERDYTARLEVNVN